MIAATLEAVSQAVAPFGLRATWHLAQRMVEYGISTEQVVDAVQSGRCFRDSDTGAMAYYKDGVAVIREGDSLVTAYRGKIKVRWVPI